MSFDPTDLSHYPKGPGVYIMKDTDNTVIYVGKAKNIQKRLKQYFSSHSDNRAIVKILKKHIAYIDTIIVTNEKEALLLENTLIKKYLPKYNILLKDDKTYISLVLVHHKWPMLKLVRVKATPPNNKNTYFGPYTSTLAARQTLDLITQFFKLRSCSNSELTKRDRPCILYEINKCLAPCVNKCTKEEYMLNVDKAKKLLQGKDTTTLKELSLKMKKASSSLLFEEAQKYYNIIQQLHHVLQNQNVANTIMCCDVINYIRSNTDATISILFYRDNKLIGSQDFNFFNVISSDSDLITTFLLQHYKQKEMIPKEILIPNDLENFTAAAEILSNIATKKTMIIKPTKGQKLKLLSLAKNNAKAAFLQKQIKTTCNDKTLIDMQEKFHLKHFPTTIECIDVSNISNTTPVASVVSYLNGIKDTTKTRHYIIPDSIKGDCPAMRHVLERHFNTAKKKTFCDLLIVDGGKAQLNTAIKVLSSANITTTDVISLTKEKSRHDKGLSQERVFIKNHPSPVILPIKSSLLFFLQKIRDEAHRSVITFHRKRRNKSTMASSLEEIEGIGPTKRKALLKKFHSINEIQTLTKGELASVKELTKKDVAAILQFFKK
jgi:excinuclease ABC subunit C